MHPNNLDNWKHDHIFGQHRQRKGESRTIMVIALTFGMMLIEITTGVLFGSMALLADGLHMASHTVALGINAFAYVYARRHAHDTRYCFGTGKVNALGGFSGAILLALFACLMALESIGRFIEPVEIVFNQAIFVAFAGLVVNGISVIILGGGEQKHGDDGHHHDHSHHHDHNLKSAYLHVLADALTSILAIIALLAAKYFGYVWMDPAMGIIGAMLVGNWSIGLLRTSGFVLLDRQGPGHLRQRIQERIEADGDSRIADLHLWSIGPGIYSLELTVVAHSPVSPDEYKARFADDIRLAHISIEIHQSPEAQVSQ